VSRVTGRRGTAKVDLVFVSDRASAREQPGRARYAARASCTVGRGSGAIVVNDRRSHSTPRQAYAPPVPLVESARRAGVQSPGGADTPQAKAAPLGGPVDERPAATDIRFRARLRLVRRECPGWARPVATSIAGAVDARTAAPGVTGASRARCAPRATRSPESSRAPCSSRCHRPPACGRARGRRVCRRVARSPGATERSVRPS
jgi:hypothetical protein